MKKRVVYGRGRHKLGGRKPYINDGKTYLGSWLKTPSITNGKIYVGGKPKRKKMRGRKAVRGKGLGTIVTGLAGKLVGRLLQLLG